MKYAADMIAVNITDIITEVIIMVTEVVEVITTAVLMTAVFAFCAVLLEEDPAVVAAEV